MCAIPQQQSTDEADLYDTDIIAWAEQQAHLLRSGHLADLDTEHIAAKIDEVAKKEQCELASRMAVLLAHLMKWHYQPERRDHCCSITIRTQRSRIAQRLRRTPSLHKSLRDSDWWADAWHQALDIATGETGLADLPRVCPWPIDRVLDDGWLPVASRP